MYRIHACEMGMTKVVVGIVVSTYSDKSNDWSKFSTSSFRASVDMSLVLANGIWVKMRC
jgi:hypothetical protein